MWNESNMGRYSQRRFVISFSKKHVSVFFRYSRVPSSPFWWDFESHVLAIPGLECDPVDVTWCGVCYRPCSDPWRRFAPFLAVRGLQNDGQIRITSKTLTLPRYLTIHASTGQPLSGETTLEVRSWSIDWRLAGFVVRSTRVAELRAQPRKQARLRGRFRRHQPEEGVMLNAGLPQFLGGPVVLQLEADRGLILLELARPDLDVEVVSLVRDFQNLGPREAVDSESEGRTQKLKQFLIWNRIFDKYSWFWKSGYLHINVKSG